MDQPIELTTGQRLVLTIEDIGFGGEGIGRAGEFVVFVPFVAIGEEVEVELTEVKKRFGRARLIRVITASALRVTPRCQHFGECGGCQYQHLEYTEQLRLKHKQIRDLFQRVGGFADPPITPVVPTIMINSIWNA